MKYYAYNDVHFFYYSYINLSKFYMILQIQAMSAIFFAPKNVTTYHWGAYFSEFFFNIYLHIYIPASTGYLNEALFLKSVLGNLH